MPIKQQQIWLLGGSGDVGSKTARALSSAMPLSLVIVGRNTGRAAAVAETAGPNARAVTLDVTRPDAPLVIEAGATVINFVEATPPSLADAVVAQGGRFIETSASPDYVTALEGAQLPGFAVLHAGLAPGLTNVMAAEIKRQAPDTVTIDVVVEPGMSRHHGNAGTLWTLRSAGIDYPLRLCGRESRLPAGALSRRVSFRGDAKDRTAIGFGFSDQYAMARNLELSTARTFLAIESAWITHALSMFLAMGLGRWVARHAAAIARLVNSGPTFGRSGTRVMAEGFNSEGKPTGRMEIHSANQAEMTAVMIVEAVRAALATHSRGVVQFAWLISFNNAAAALTQALPETRVFSQPEPFESPPERNCFDDAHT
jgi:hypothetical protein